MDLLEQLEKSYKRDLGPLDGLRIFNKIMAGMSLGMGKTITARRLWALDVYKKRFERYLPNLLADFKWYHPHWINGELKLKDPYKQLMFLRQFIIKMELNSYPICSLDQYFPLVRRSRAYYS